MKMNPCTKLKKQKDLNQNSRISRAVEIEIKIPVLFQEFQNP